MKYVLIMVFMSGHGSGNIETLTIDFESRSQCIVVMDKIKSELGRDVVSSGCYRK